MPGKGEKTFVYAKFTPGKKSLPYPTIIPLQGGVLKEKLSEKRELDGVKF